MHPALHLPLLLLHDAMIRQEKPYFGQAGCFLARRLLDETTGAGREIRSILSVRQKDTRA